MEESDAGLVVSFLGQIFRPEKQLPFGRIADLVLDEGNLQMHRRAGRFRMRAGEWRVENIGTRIELELVSAAGAATTLSAGSELGLPFGEGVVRLMAGGARYELEYAHAGGAELTEPVNSRAGEAKTAFAPIALTGRQRQVLALLCERRLRHQRRAPATHAEIAKRLSIAQGTVRRHLDDIRDRVRSAGLAHGAVSVPEDLVEFAVRNRLVTLTDLAERD